MRWGAGRFVRVWSPKAVSPAKAAVATWPNAEARRCEWHLTRNLLKNLPSRARESPDDPLRALLSRAKGSVEGWKAYLDGTTSAPRQNAGGRQR